MEIKVAKQTTTQEIINIEVPAFFKTDYASYKIIDGKITRVGKNLCLVTRATDFLGMDREVQEALTGVKITEEEFNKTMEEFLNNLSS